MIARGNHSGNTAPLNPSPLMFQTTGSGIASAATKSSNGRRREKEVSLPPSPWVLPSTDEEMPPASLNSIPGTVSCASQRPVARLSFPCRRLTIKWPSSRRMATRGLFTPFSFFQVVKMNQVKDVEDSFPRCRRGGTTSHGAEIPSL